MMVRHTLSDGNRRGMVKPIVGGAWFEIDTTWRMVADLNHILRYCAIDGNLMSVPQRRLFAVVDGVVAGERDGPLAPSPRSLGLIVAGDNPWSVDVVCAAIVGFDWQKLPLLSGSVWREGSSVLGGAESNIELASNVHELSTWEGLHRSAFYLEPPPGWAGEIERSTP